MNGWNGGGVLRYSNLSAEEKKKGTLQNHYDWTSAMVVLSRLRASAHDGSTVAENYLQRRRDASNPTTSSDYVQTDSKERRWRPGLNELGLTMCSACGPNGKLSTSG